VRIYHVVNRFAAVVCLAGLIFSASAAFKVGPMTLVFDVKNGQRTGWLDIQHTGGGPMAIELVAYERRLDSNGVLIMDPLVETKDFVIHPAQIVLYPGDSTRVQVMLKSRNKITADRTYQIFSKEVPLPMPAEDGAPRVRAGVNVLMNYYTVLYLNTGRPGSLTFASSRKLPGGKIEVVAQNNSAGRFQTGKLYIMVGRHKVTEFTGKGNSVMPGDTRVFTFEFDRPVTAKEVKFLQD
jgi:P pilus assembly chaperone PapD